MRPGDQAMRHLQRAGATGNKSRRTKIKEIGEQQMQGPPAEREHPAEPINPDPAQPGGANAGLKRCVASFDCRNPNKGKGREEKRGVFSR